MNKSYWGHPRLNVSLTMIDTGETGEYDKRRVGYSFRWNKKVLFKGNDFFTPRGMEPLGAEARYSLLSFLTLQEGDADAEYFADYTDEQKAWCQSSDCEELKYWVSEQEERRGWQ